MPDIPQFTRVGDEPILGFDAIRWEAKNPSVMFPTVIEAPEWITQPRDRLYMYYASHHGTALGLATAPEPEGPWTVHDPIFDLANAPMISGHVSSPDVLIDEAACRVYLYYHGSNAAGLGQVMGCAVGYDGLHFAVENHRPLILPSEREGWWDSHSTAYLRPFCVGERILGIYMGNGGASVPGVAYNCQGLLCSRDYLRWERVREEPLLSPDEQDDWGTIRHVGVHVREDEGAVDVYYSTRTGPDLDREVLRLARVDATIPPGEWQAEKLGTVLEPTLDWEGDDLRDPYVFEWEDRSYLYYAGGMEAGIGLAVAT